MPETVTSCRDRLAEGEGGDHCEGGLMHKTVGPRLIGTAGPPARMLFELMTARELAAYIGLFGIGAVPSWLINRSLRVAGALELLNRERIPVRAGGSS